MSQDAREIGTLWQHDETGRKGIEFDDEPRSYSHMAGWKPCGRVAVLSARESQPAGEADARTVDQATAIQCVTWLRDWAKTAKTNQQKEYAYLCANIIAECYERSAPAVPMKREPQVPRLPKFMRERLLRECNAADNPVGMSTHDGKVRVLSNDVRRLIEIIDAASTRSWL